MDETRRRFFEQLYQTYSRLMLAQAVRYTKRTDDAEDVVQEALEKLLDKYAVLSTLGDRSLAAYVVYTVRSTAINRLKQSSKTIPLDALEEAAPPAPSAEELYLASCSREALLAAWKQLDREDQLLLAQRYYLELTAEELAGVYGCTPVNIRVRLFRARSRLKKQLASTRGDE